MPENKQLPEYTKLAIRGASLPWPIGLVINLEAAIQDAHGAVSDKDGQRVLVIDKLDVEWVSIVGYVPVENKEVLRCQENT